MVTFEEYKVGNQSKYIVHMFDDLGKECHKREVKFPLYEIKDNCLYFILYNDE